MAIDDAINFKIYLQSSSRARSNRDKKRKIEIQKFEYLANEVFPKSFLDEIKSIFRNFEFISFGVKKKKKIHATQEFSIFQA